MTSNRVLSILALLSITSIGAACNGGADSDDDGGTGNEDTAGDSGTTGGGPGTDDAEPDTGQTDDGPDGTGTDDTTGGDPDPGLLGGPTKGGPILANDAGDTLAVANKANDDITLFSLPDLEVRGRVDVGDEPVSVSWSPDNSTLYVVNRGDGSVTEVLDANTDSPTPGSTVAVGSETVQAALSPSGAQLYVTSFVDATLNIIDTSSMRVTDQIVLGGNPHGICVSNDADDEDGDETIYVTDFFGAPAAGEVEASDTSREGRVFRVNAGDLTVDESFIAAFTDSTFPGFEDTGFFPNQLYSCIVNDEHVYVTAVGASPQPFENGTDFHQNVQGMVAALDAATGEEDTSRSVNLNTLVGALDGPKRFVPIPMDIAFAAGSDFGYVASTASNAVFRIDWEASPPTGGSPSGANFLPTAPSPTGVTIVGTTAYAYNEVDRSISAIDLATQETVETAVESAPDPTTAAEESSLRGQRFFNTGMARWSTNGWVSCLACHPAGLTDNVTWVFPAGPRQTVDLSPTFNEGGTVQRILNWTAIFDEVHDFELNTRGVAGGTGAIVSAADLNADGTANTDARIDFVGPGGVGDPANGFNIGSSRAIAQSGATPEDWDDIMNYIMTIRAPKAATVYDGDPAAGREVFEAGGCQNCHGGPLWTLSERYYTPVINLDARPLSLLSQGISEIEVRADQVATTNPAEMFVLDTDANGPPHRHSCVVRIVDTFDAAGPDDRGAPEVRQNGGNAQGVDGFNVPSLMGMAVGGPFLHNGAAETLQDLLDPDGDFTTHLRGGNQVFAPTEQEVADLVAFLRSIDDDTEQIAVPQDQVICPDGLVFE